MGSEANDLIDTYMPIFVSNKLKRIRPNTIVELLPSAVNIAPAGLLGCKLRDDHYIHTRRRSRAYWRDFPANTGRCSNVVSVLVDSYNNEMFRDITGSLPVQRRICLHNQIMVRYMAALAVMTQCI